MNLSIFTYTNDSKMYSNYELFLSSKVVTKKRMVTFATHFISRRILAQFWRSNVRASQVYLWSTTNKTQRFLDLFIPMNCCTCFRRFHHPTSGAQNCTYSVRYCQTNIAFHLIHDSSRQQYWFDNTWRCMYSFVLLVMGGGTVWNMLEQFIETNRPRKSCMLLAVIQRYTCDARRWRTSSGSLTS